MLLLDLAFVLAFYKELKVSTFDPELAAALGFSPVLLHYLLMGAVSVTVVGAFESVGAILVVAMLVVPPATAYLFTDRLGRMLALAVGLGVASAVGGLRRWRAGSTLRSPAPWRRWRGCSSSWALAASPGHGLVARALRHRRLRRRLTGRIVLLHLREEGEAVPAATVERRFGWSRAAPGRACWTSSCPGLGEPGRRRAAPDRGRGPGGGSRRRARAGARW